MTFYFQYVTIRVNILIGVIQMKLISLNSTDHYFNQSMELYTKEFPAEICEPVEVFYKSFDLKSKNYERYHFVVAYEDNTVLGFIAFHLEVTYSIGYIVYLVVNEKARGKNIARTLMNEAEQTMKTLCEENGTTLKTIMLECEKDAHGKSPLAGFYDKFGFEQYEINYYQPGLRSDAPVPMNLFVKSLESHNNQQFAIEYIYRTKYGTCNEIDEHIINDLLSNMR